MNRDEQIAELRSRFEGDPIVTVLTGAGISAASGIPTFRGDDGLWDEFDVEDLASPQGFRRDPEKVWKWYDKRRQQIADIEPNRGHEVLAEWSTRYTGFTLVTQNVDGLHLEAGTKNVVKLHGDIWEVSCWDNCESSPRKWEKREVPLSEIPPRCSDCGSLIRPEVVWFGEQLDPEVLQAAQRAVKCDLFFTIGTSAEVHPAAGFIPEASAQGAYTVEINPNSTSATSAVDLSIQEPSEEFLDDLENVLNE